MCFDGFLAVVQPSPGAAIRPLGRRRNGGWVLFCPSPGGRVRALGRRRNGGWDYFVPRRAGASAPLAAAAMAAEPTTVS